MYVFGDCYVVRWLWACFGCVRVLNMLASGRNCSRVRLGVGLFKVPDCWGFVAYVCFWVGVIASGGLLFAG